MLKTCDVIVFHARVTNVIRRRVRVASVKKQILQNRLFVSSYHHHNVSRNTVISCCLKYRRSSSSTKTKLR